MMRGIRLMFMFLAVAGGVVLSACNKDKSEDNDALEAAVAGKWKVTDMGIGIAAVDNIIAGAKESLLSDIFPDEYLEFTSDKNYTRTKRTSEIVEKGTYTVSGGQITVTYKAVADGKETGDTKTKTMNAQVDGTKMILTDKYSEYAQYFTGIIDSSYASILGSASFKITLTKQ